MILEFENVSKSYGDIRALDGLSFGVRRGEIVAMLGPNGAGKTTAIDVLLGLRAADAGAVRLFGGSPRRVATRRRLGATPQESGFPDMLRVDEILSFVACHYRAPMAATLALERFGLAALAKRRAGTLSQGQSRRLALALAFIGNPELVVLDEPTTGLDVESRRGLWEVARDLSAERSILFTTHYLEEAQAMATRILVVDRGRLLFDGDALALRARVGGGRLTYVGDAVEPALLGGEAVVTQRGGRVEVTTSDADACVRALVTAGVAFSNLEISRPSLEEAFLLMTGGKP